MDNSMKKLILALLFGLLAVPALQAAQAGEDEVKLSVAELALEHKANCRLCGKQLRKPIQLPCGHNNKFDTDCFKKYMYGQVGQNAPIECLVCNKTISRRVALFLDSPKETFAELMRREQDTAFARFEAVIARSREVAASSAQAMDDLDAAVNEHGEVIQRIIDRRKERQKKEQRQSFAITSLLSPIAFTGGILMLKNSKNVVPDQRTAHVVAGTFCSCIGILGACAAYQNCPPEVAEAVQNKLQRTKDFIKRHKPEMGALTALARWGLIGKHQPEKRK
jgi:hypothetical protein